MITGRKPGEKFMEYAQITGMIILLALLLYANANDVIKLFK
jgi:regulator of sigma E protease